MADTIKQTWRLAFRFFAFGTPPLTLEPAARVLASFAVVEAPLTAVTAPSATELFSFPEEPEEDEALSFLRSRSAAAPLQGFKGRGRGGWKSSSSSLSPSKVTAVNLGREAGATVGEGEGFAESLPLAGICSPEAEGWENAKRGTELQKSDPKIVVCQGVLKEDRKSIEIFVFLVLFENIFLQITS